MNYKLDGIDISSYSAKPYIGRDGCIALSGVFDLPPRKGTTEYNWGTSIEPFTDSSDIELDGRNLTLSMLVRGKANLQYLKSACVSCQKLWTEFGEFNVVQRGSIKVEEYLEDLASVSVDFWQQDYKFKVFAFPPNNTGTFRIDGYNMMVFGIFISDTEGKEDVPKRIDIKTTLPYNKSLYRELGNVTLKCFMKGDSLEELHYKMALFHYLCMRPGLRNLLLGDIAYNIYFKDGITVDVPHNELLEFDLKFRIV